MITTISSQNMSFNQIHERWLIKILLLVKVSYLILTNKCITILDEAEAITAALDSAPQSSLVVVFPDKVDAAIGIIEARKSKLS
jgi:cyanophycin synthetase